MDAGLDRVWSGTQMTAGIEPADLKGRRDEGEGGIRILLITVIIDYLN